MKSTFAVVILNQRQGIQHSGTRCNHIQHTNYMTLSKMALDTECRYAEYLLCSALLCSVSLYHYITSSVVMLNIIMLNVVAWLCQVKCKDCTKVFV